MRLRDMLAAAVRPWVRVRSDESTLRIDIGKKVGFCSRWSVSMRDDGQRNSRRPCADIVAEFLGHTHPENGQREVRLIGDLRVGWNSRKRFERAAAEWRAKRGNVDLFNDSKAAA